MELASMLAGEPFTDHPASVCPVIGSFLRSYNDSIDDERRQSLYEFASKVVGSRRSGRVQQTRAERLARWADDMYHARRAWLALRPLRALGRLRKPSAEAIGMYAVHAIGKHDDHTHAAVLALLDELVSVGVRDDRVSARVIAARSGALDRAA
jgi:hypothetical protein